MRISKSILAGTLLFACIAMGLSAAPEPAAPTAESEVAQPADLFGASLLSPPDCGGPAEASRVADDPLFCGSCTPFACKFKEEGEQCSTSPVRFCQAVPGQFCSIDGNALCECV